MIPKIGDWFSYNAGGYKVSCQVLDIHVKKRWFGLVKEKDYEVAQWVIKVHPGSCYRYPVTRLSESQIETIYSCLRLGKTFIVGHDNKIARVEPAQS